MIKGVEPVQDNQIQMVLQILQSNGKFRQFLRRGFSYQKIVPAAGHRYDHEKVGE